MLSSRRKKVVFAIKSLSFTHGGAEKVITQIANNISETEIDVLIISFDTPNSSSLYEISKNIEYIRLGVGKTNTRASIISTLKRIIALRKEIKMQKPDLVIGFMHSIFIPLAFALIGTKITLIASEHIVPQHYKKRKIEFALFVISSLFLKKITVLSETIKNSYPKFMQHKMIAITNPVEQAPEQYKKDSENNIILNVGRLEEQKNQTLLIHSFHKLIQTHPQWTLRIVGDGSMRSSLQDLVTDLNLSDHVTFTGEISEIQKEYMRGDVYALSSDYESFGLSVVEAMSYGLPVIGFADCPGVNELIVNNKNGLLISANQHNRIDEFTKGLEQLIISAKFRAKLGEEGVQTSRQFSPDKIAKQWVNIIEKNA